MKVLALSTSTPRGGVAIVSGDQVLAEITHDDPRGHAEHLFSLIDEALARASMRREDLELVACDIGPGSFTGVRIAVASAKGIAVGLGLPLAGVVSLEAMAVDARGGLGSGEPVIVAAAIDAKKDELYVGVYEVGPAGAIERMAPAHFPIADAGRRVIEEIGDRPFVSIVDATSFADFACALGRAPERQLVAWPSAAWVGRIAALRSGAGVAVLEPSEIVPLYVRAPDAVPSPSGTPVALAMLPAR